MKNNRFESDAQVSERGNRSSAGVMSRPSPVATSISQIVSSPGTPGEPIDARRQAIFVPSGDTVTPCPKLNGPSVSTRRLPERTSIATRSEVRSVTEVRRLRRTNNVAPSGLMANAPSSPSSSPTATWRSSVSPPSGRGSATKYRRFAWPEVVVPVANRKPLEELGGDARLLASRGELAVCVEGVGARRHTDRQRHTSGVGCHGESGDTARWVDQHVGLATTGRQTPQSTIRFLGIGCGDSVGVGSSRHEVQRPIWSEQRSAIAFC